MKGTKLMRIVALLMAMLMVFSTAACTDSGSSSKKNQKDKETEAYDDGKVEEPIEIVEDENVLEDSDLRYVMIYNPRIYDENATYDSSVLKTGYLGNQVDVSAYRADGLEDEGIPVYTYPQNLLGDLPADLVIEQNRADAMGETYSVGDVATFYAPTALNIDNRQATQFTCAYEGQYCYVWVIGAANQADAKAVADEFDTKVYKTVTETFGPARFDASAGGKGKINLVFAPMASGYLGVHYMGDIFATGEISAQQAAYYKFNLDHDILFVNSSAFGNSYYGNQFYSTLAHEFQHLIMATAALNTIEGTFCRTWLNESMSGYIEEVVYPGVQKEAMRPVSLMQSDLIRGGQSLYNFTTTIGMYSSDIGVYGSVYVFSEYLADLAGDDVFSKFHKYWRESYSSTLCEAEALVNSVSPSVKAEIDSTIVYPSSLTFTSDDEEWMSKLALDFYLSMFAKEGNLAAYQPINNSALLYDEINGADIEGGGRIIVAVDSKFEIPEDADAGLIYVGLDENYQPVTSFIYK